MTKNKTLAEPSATDKIPVLVALYDFFLLARGIKSEILPLHTISAFIVTHSDGLRRQNSWVQNLRTRPLLNSNIVYIIKIE